MAKASHCKPEPPGASVSGEVAHLLRPAEVAGVEDGVKDPLEVMAGRWIAVQIERPRWSQNPMQFHKANGHLDKIRKHLARANPGPQGRDDLGDAVWDAAVMVGCAGVERA